jgi:hypothetical protein
MEFTLSLSSGQYMNHPPTSALRLPSHPSSRGGAERRNVNGRFDARPSIASEAQIF